MPASIEMVRRKLKGSDDGDRQMVKVLGAVLSDGLAAFEAACAEALEAGLAYADVILNLLARASKAEIAGQAGPLHQVPDALGQAAAHQGTG